MNIGMRLNKTYWQHRYEARNTGWDMGMVSPPLGAYIDQLTEKNINILLPGAGMGYEAVYLAEAGFEALTILDIAPYPLESLKERLPASFSAENLVEADFFDFEAGPFDLVLEHTFFCALPPQLRPQYALKMNDTTTARRKTLRALIRFPINFGRPALRRFKGGIRAIVRTLLPYTGSGTGDKFHPTASGK